MTDETPAARRGRAKPGTDFSRLPQVQQVDPRPSVVDESPDLDGRRALFSAPGGPPPDHRPAAPGAVVVECGGCGERTVLTPAQWLALAVPSLHLPYLKRDHGSWMRCPACRRRTWVSVQIQLS